MSARDPRLPLRFGPATGRRPGDAVLHEGAGSVPQPSLGLASPGSVHGLGCACCAPRSAASVALARLFRTRALGTDFTAVLAAVTPATEAAIRLALREDALAAARFRLEEG